MANTFEQLKAILDSGELDGLIGLDEDAILEAKSPRPYDLTRIVGRIELAKDVSAFANARGGYVIAGVKHSRVPSENVDRITALDLLSEEEFDVEKTRGVIQVGIYPKIEGLVIHWAPARSTPSQGVGVIHVPQQQDDAKPYLMVHTVIDDTKLKQIVFGLAQRQGSAAVVFSIKELHRLTKRGGQSDTQRLVRIEEKLDRLAAPPPPRQGPSRTSLSERLNEISGDDV